MVIRHQVKEDLEYTNSPCMKAKNITVTHVTIRQLQAEAYINSQNMKERNIPVTHVTIKQLKEET